MNIDSTHVSKAHKNRKPQVYAPTKQRPIKPPHSPASPSSAAPKTVSTHSASGYDNFPQSQDEHREKTTTQMDWIVSDPTKGRQVGDID